MIKILIKTKLTAVITRQIKKRYDFCQMNMNSDYFDDNMRLSIKQNTRVERRVYVMISIRVMCGDGGILDLIVGRKAEYATIRVAMFAILFFI